MLSIYKSPFTYMLLTALVALGASACEKKKKAQPPKKSSSTAPVIPGGSSFESLSITVSGETGVFGDLKVKGINQMVNWTFSASVSGGSGTAKITRIDFSGTQPAGITMPPLGNSPTASISFTPRSQAELTGSLTVYAEATTSDGKSLSEQTAYSWSLADGAAADQTKKGNGFMGIILKVLPSILSGGGLKDILISALPQISDMMNDQNP